MDSEITMDAQFPVVVPAAGIGSRMGADIPKQYLPLLGKTVLEQTLLRLNAHPNINQVIVALHPADEHFQQLEIASAPWLTSIKGGEERADSVLNGLLCCQEQPWVLVHDAARPCVRHNDISKLLALHNGQYGGLLARRATDTLKRVQTNQDRVQPLVATTEDRSQFWHALTPQFFPTQQLIDALAYCAKQGLVVTDEASAIEQTNGNVVLVEGASDNIKITLPLDLALAEFYLQQQGGTA